LAGYYNTFIVRLWHDTTGKQIRGQIEHTGTLEKAHFISLEDMNEFILNYLRKPPNGLNGAKEVIVVEKQDKPGVKTGLKSKQHK
jgi:hypothetical protein